MIFLGGVRSAIGRDDRSDRVQNKFAWQVEGGRNLRGTRRLVVTLRRHNIIARGAKLQACRRVNRVINAAVQRNKAAQKFFVGGVYNRVDGKPRNVTPSNLYARRNVRNVFRLDDTALQNLRR